MNELGKVHWCPELEEYLLTCTLVAEDKVYLSTGGCVTRSRVKAGKLELVCTTEELFEALSLYRRHNK